MAWTVASLVASFVSQKPAFCQSFIVFTDPSNQQQLLLRIAHWIQEDDEETQETKMEINVYIVHRLHNVVIVCNAVHDNV